MLPRLRYHLNLVFNTISCALHLIFRWVLQRGASRRDSTSFPWNSMEAEFLIDAWVTLVLPSWVLLRRESWRDSTARPVTPVFSNIGVSIMHKKIRRKLNKSVGSVAFFQGIVAFSREKTLYCRNSDILNNWCHRPQKLETQSFP